MKEFHDKGNRFTVLEGQPAKLPKNPSLEEIVHSSVMPLAGKLGGFSLPGTCGCNPTLFQPGGANYVHYTTASPPGLENLTASL